MMSAYKEALKKKLAGLKEGPHHMDEGVHSAMASEENPATKMLDEAPELKTHGMDGHMNPPNPAAGIAPDAQEESAEHADDVQQDTDLIHKILAETALGKKALSVTSDKHALAQKHAKAAALSKLAIKK